MFGRKCIKLINDLNQSNKSDVLPPYQKELVNEVLAEMKELYNLNKRDLTSATSDEERQNLAAVAKARHASLLWNKRCLIAYHYNRLMSLKEIRWQLGAILPDEMRTNLATHEIQWFMYYCDNLANYMSKLNNNQGMDLTLYKNVPKSLYIQVKCLVDYGDFELDDGRKVFLSIGSIHYLPLYQCEKLLRLGILEQIS